MVVAVFIIPLAIVAAVGTLGYLLYRFVVYDFFCNRTVNQTLRKYKIKKTQFQIIKEYHESKAENDLKRIEVEARQAEAQAIGIANANIAQANGEAEAIRVINQALSENPNYLEWLKTQAWDGKLPLVVGQGGTPFIQIPTKP